MQPYFQTTPYTTAASSLLTVVHHLNPGIELSRENEFDIWERTVTLPTRGSSIFALANYAHQLGLKLKVVVEKKEYSFPDYRFYRYTKDDIDRAAFSAGLHLKKAEDCQVIIEQKEITLKIIKQELSKGNILILRLNTKPIRNEKRNTSNYVVVQGYKENYFQIIDPGFGAFSLPEQVMKEAFYTLETKKYRDHRMIVFWDKTSDKDKNV